MAETWDKGERREGREQQPLEIKIGRRLGEGNFGEVFSVQAVFEEGGERVERPMVLKIFKGGQDEAVDYSLEVAQEHARAAVENHHIAVAAGLKVLATYNLCETGERVLMTDGNLDGRVCVSDDWRSSARLSDFGVELRKITNFRELLKEVYQQAMKAVENNLAVNHDTYFFAVDTKRVGQVGIVLGDMDRLLSEKWGGRVYAQGDFWEFNLRNAKRAVAGFIESHVKQSTRLKLLEQLTEFDLAVRRRRGEKIE